MRERLVCLCPLLVLCALSLVCAAAGPCWAVPLIAGVSVERGLDTGWEGSVSSHEWVIVYVEDPEGAADLASVRVIDSRDQPHDAWCWTTNEGGTWAEFWWQSYGQATPPPAGTYVVQLNDQGGELTDEAMADASDVLDVTPAILTPAPNGSVVDGDPTFSWSAPEGVGCFCIGVNEVDGPCAIWCPWTSGDRPATSPVDYSYDGTGPELIPGHTYDWHVISHVPDPIAQSDPRVWATFAGIAGGRFRVYSPVPAVEFVGIVAGRSVGPDGGEWYGDSAEITVFDADGWDGMSVSTVDPNGRLRPGPGDSCDYWNEGEYLLHQAWAQYGRMEPLNTGSYEVTAEDAQGNLSVPVAATFEEYPLVPDISWPENGSVILETTPTFAWEVVPGACRYDIYLHEIAPDPHGVWGMSELPPTTTTVLYNEDESATDPTLVPGATYLFHVTAYYPDQDPSNRVWIASGSERIVEFTVYSPAPKVARFEVRRGIWAVPDGPPRNEQWAKALVSDPQGTDTIATVTVTDSQGQGHDAWLACQLDADTAVYCWTSYDEEHPSPAGTYTVTAIDQDGNTDSVSAQVSAVPEDPGCVPAIESPPANYSVSPDPPTFAWSAPLGAGCYCLRMKEVDGECAVWCPPGPVSSPIPYDGSGSLLPGRLYEWDLYSWMDDEIEQADPRAFSGFVFTSTGRFWLEPKFVGFLEPINSDGSSIFKLNSTVPVKFRLLNADGSYVSDAVATLSVAKVEEQVVGTYQEAVSAAAADSGNAFRYDPGASQYVLNLGTRGMSAGTWSLQVTVDGVAAREVLISLE